MNYCKKHALICWVFLLAAIEAISWPALFYPDFGRIFFIVIAVALAALVIYRLEYGLMAAATELIIGSQGYMFFLTVGDYKFPVRMLIWLIIMSVWAYQARIWRFSTWRAYWLNLKNSKILYFSLALALFLFVSLLNAYWRGNAWSNIFRDFNAWLYFLLALPALHVYFFKNIEERDLSRKRLFNFISAALIWLSLKTLIYLFVFTHNFSFAPDLYYWLRKTLVGEMTPTASGWPRIFLQSQIYAAIAWLILFWSWGEKTFSLKKIFLSPATWSGALFMSSVLISFSRSFWLAMLVALAFSAVALIVRFSWRRLLPAAAWSLISLIIGFLMIYAVAAFPFPQPGKFNANFLDRASLNNNEAALASRWSLLPELASSIKSSPLIGKGFGSTVTYYSRDPRVLQSNPSGLYTTYAFEWGYLDTWLKIGMLGLLAYLAILISLGKSAWRSGKIGGLAWLSGLVFLATVNAFTPYLNHPLGIAYLIFASCFISQDRVY